MAGRRTPAIVVAERAGIWFAVHEYHHDPGTSSYGLEAARELGVDAARVFKTLIVGLDGTLTVVVLPVDAQLDLRALGKRAALVETSLAERTTGYVAGGISPLGQRKRLPTLIDDSALGFDTIHVSAGRRGLQLELAPADLLTLTEGRACSLAATR